MHETRKNKAVAYLGNLSLRDRAALYRKRRSRGSDAGRNGPYLRRGHVDATRGGEGRDAFVALLDAAEGGEISVVLVESIDRVPRDLDGLGDDLSRPGVEVHEAHVRGVRITEPPARRTEVR